MKNNYLLLGIAAIGIVIISGGIFFLAKTKNSPTYQKELNIQISPLQKGNLATPSTISSPKVTSPNYQEIPLEILSPKDQAFVSSDRITVSGKTKPKSDVVVNDQEIKADNNGNFSTQVTLDEGENIIGIVAYDENGNYAEKEIIVTYEPEE